MNTRNHPGHTRQQSITRAALFVAELLARELPPWALYHSPRHTRQTVAACREIGGALHLEKETMEVVLLAAWFHDTGYAFKVRGHEERSAEIAERFLQAEGCPVRTIRGVMACILATRMPQRPRSLRERVLCDADLISLGKRSFLKQNELLRQEMERREGRLISEKVWLHRSYRFLHRHRFSTPYGRTVLESGKQANIARLRRMIRMQDRGENKTR
jgi:predicted metal-dependent HD superfamily phosphohydrolase